MKRILYIVEIFWQCCLSMRSEKFIFRPDQVNSATEYGSRYTAAHLIQGLGSYGTTVNTGTGVVSAFICIYAAVCIYCYLCSASSGRKLTDNLIYVSFCSLGLSVPDIRLLLILAGALGSVYMSAYAAQQEASEHKYTSGDAHDGIAFYCEAIFGRLGCRK